MSLFTFDAAIKARLAAEVGPFLPAGSVIAGVFDTVDFANADTLQVALRSTCTGANVTALLKRESRAIAATGWVIEVYLHRTRVDAGSQAEALEIPDRVVNAISGWAPDTATPAGQYLKAELTGASVSEDGPLLIVTLNFDIPAVVGSLN